MKPLLFCIYALSITTWAQNWINIDAENSRIYYSGRIWPSDQKWNSHTCQMFSWPGTSASFRFEGTAIKAILNKPATTTGTDSSWYKVFVDGEPTKDIAFKDYNTATEIILAEGLAVGEHTVSLYKRTEAIMGSQVFCGFSYQGSASSPTLKVPKRKLEFIGNSITCGYGALDHCTVNTSTWKLDNCPGFTTTSEDHYVTYAAIAARTLNAQEQTICWSGKGLYLNKGNDMSPPVPALWNYAQPSQQYSDTGTVSKWDYSKYVPDAVVIDLGTNDFNPNAPPETEFVNAYVSFIQNIKSKYGTGTQILLLHGPMISDGYPAGQQSATKLSNYIDAAIAKTDTATVHKVILTTTKSLEYGVGSDWHPNEQQHQLNATELVSALQKYLGWSNAGDSIPSVIRKAQQGPAVQYQSWNQVIELLISTPGYYQVSVNNLQGRMLFKSNFRLEEGLHSLPVSQLISQSGMYIFQIQGRGLHYSRTIMIF